MFYLDDFLADPLELGQPLGRRPFRLLRNVLTRKPHRFLPPNVPELRVPADPAACQLIDEMLTDVESTHGDDGLRAVRAVIERPRIRAASRLRHGASRDYTLMAPIARAQEPWRVVVLTVRVGPKADRRLIAIRCRLIPHERVDDIRSELAAVYQDAEGRDELRRKDRVAVTWLRGHRAGEIPEDWAEQLEALAATFGIALEVVGEPDVRPDALVPRLRRRAPVSVIVWDHDGRGTELAARAGLAALGVDIVYVGRAWPEVRQRAAEVFALMAGVPPPQRIAPPTVVDAVLAVPPHEDVVILQDAVSSAQASVFRRPADVFTALESIVAAVADGALAKDGGLPAALAGGPFRYASGISSTAKQQYRSAYERNYDGRRIMLGPHLKLGAGSPEHCLRIYWYVDQESGKVVIGHVGEHLPDAGS